MSVVINGTTGIVSPKVNALDLELDSKNVVERGSNANGEYVRFADGTQICTAIIDETKDVTTAYSGGFVSTSSTYAFAAAFSGSGVIIVGNHLFGLSACKPLVMVNAGGSAGGWNCQHYANTSGTAVSIRGRWLAIGRWY